MYQSNPLLEKSLKFAARIVKLYQYLVKEKKETIYQNRYYGQERLSALMQTKQLTAQVRQTL